MKLDVTFLWLNALFFVAYGLAFAFAPTFLSELVTGAAPATPSALADARATYGGMTIGVGVIFGLCARSASTRTLGLWAIAAVMFFMAAGRTLGIAQDGSVNALMFVYLGAEIIVMTIALWAQRTSSSAPLQADSVGVGGRTADSAR